MPEEKQVLTEEQIVEKANKGEKLTPEEEATIMGQAHDSDFASDEVEDVEGEKEGPEEEAEEGKEAAPEEKEEEGKKEEPAPEGEEGAEEKKEESEADKLKKSEEKEEPEKTPEPEKKEGEVDFDKVERELEKQEGLEDLSKLTVRERGLYYSMKKERRARQKAEDDLNAEKFRNIKLRKELDAKKEGSEDQEEFVSRKELNEKLKAEKQADEDARAAQMRKVFIGVWEREARKECPEYQTIMDTLGPMIIGGSEFYAEEIAKAGAQGDNLAIKTYELIRADKNFDTYYEQKFGKKFGEKKEPDKEPEPEKKPDKEATHKKNEKLNENLKKPKTSGAAGGGSGEPTGEITMEDFAKMSDDDFAKLSKAKQDKLLEMYG